MMVQRIIVVPGRVKTKRSYIEEFKIQLESIIVKVKRRSAMLPSLELLKHHLGAMIDTQQQQGHEVLKFQNEFKQLPDSYDVLDDFAKRLAQAPMRQDWPYEEPNELDAIWAECDPARSLDCITPLAKEEASGRAMAAFEAAVCGCMLGKPLEVNPTLAEIRAAAEAVGAWPLDDYIPEAMLEKLGRRHPDWIGTVRERIRYVAPDDDMNYNIIGLLLLETHGPHFTKRDVMNVWLQNLPPLWLWGPERVMLLKAGMYSLQPRTTDIPFEMWVNHWNPGNEQCGAAIRVDSYGYACPGRPALAAELAWRDASWTHRRTGIYSAMFIAAAIASAFVVKDRLAIFETALQYVPQKSRFYEITADCLSMVRDAGDWLDGYQRIHTKYSDYAHCRIYQEVGTLINTMRFAPDIATGIGMQVAQGNDTDCFGEIAGSLLGAYFGPGNLDARWMEPFNDEIRTSLANFHEQTLSTVTTRIAALPELIERAL
jgi:hypothetical protein